jgi:hypothetical protein
VAIGLHFIWVTRDACIKIVILAEINALPVDFFALVAAGPETNLVSQQQG